MVRYQNYSLAVNSYKIIQNKRSNYLKRLDKPRAWLRHCRKGKHTSRAGFLPAGVYQTMLGSEAQAESIGLSG